MNARGRSADDRRPLEGRRVAVTRPAAVSAELADLLREQGAEPILLPLIETLPPTDPSDLASAASRIAEYEWIAFTSAKAVRALAAELPEDSAGVRTPGPARIAAVGPATAAAVADELGRAADLIPSGYTGRDLANAMLAEGVCRDTRVLWPRARDARHELPSLLRAAGARVDDPEAYRTEPVRAAALELHRLIARGSLSAITLTAPSAVRVLADAGTDTGSAVVAVIGASTESAARDAGLPVHIRPREHTIPALVLALARHRW